MIPDDRAVSTTLGFILVFAIVIASVSLIFGVGFDAVEDLRASEQTENAERAMRIANQNMRDIYARGAPGRSVELRITNSELTLSRTAQMTVEANVSNGGNQTLNLTTRVFEYRVSDDRAVSYEFAGTIRESRESGTFIIEPPMRFSDDRSFISAVELNGRQSVGGSGTTLVVLRRESNDLIYNKNTDPGEEVTFNITINTTSERAKAWQTYFEEEGFTKLTADIDDGDLKYQRTTDSLYVQRTDIRVEFED